jgi:hypothetical protein
MDEEAGRMITEPPAHEVVVVKPETLIQAASLRSANESETGLCGSVRDGTSATVLRRLWSTFGSHSPARCAPRLTPLGVRRTIGSSVRLQKTGQY